MCSQPRLVQRDCIEIAFDDNDRLRPTDGLAGDIKAKSVCPFLNSGVSGEFKYLGIPSPRTRPPNPTIRLRRSVMVIITRAQNRS